MKDSDRDEYKVASYYDFENDISDKCIIMFVMKNTVYPKEFTKDFFLVDVDQ